MAESIFTKIINREIPAEIVYETEDLIAFDDISPQAPHHVLVVPKKPIPTINDMEEADAELIGKLFIAAKKIASERGIAEKGYRMVINCNADAQQTVFHIHLHVIGGRKFTWPPG